MRGLVDDSCERFLRRGRIAPGYRTARVSYLRRLLASSLGYTFADGRPSRASLGHALVASADFDVEPDDFERGASPRPRDAVGVDGARSRDPLERRVRLRARAQRVEPPGGDRERVVGGVFFGGVVAGRGRRARGVRRGKNGRPSLPAPAPEDSAAPRRPLASSSSRDARARRVVVPPRRLRRAAPRAASAGSTPAGIFATARNRERAGSPPPRAFFCPRSRRLGGRPLAQPGAASAVSSSKPPGPGQGPSPWPARPVERAQIRPTRFRDPSWHAHWRAIPSPSGSGSSSRPHARHPSASMRAASSSGVIITARVLLLERPRRSREAARRRARRTSRRASAEGLKRVPGGSGRRAHATLAGNRTKSASRFVRASNASRAEAARATTREEGHRDASRRRGSSRDTIATSISGGAAGRRQVRRRVPRASAYHVPARGRPGSTTSGATRQYLPELNRRQTRKWRSSTTSPSSTRAALTASAAGIAGSVASTRAPGPCDSHSLGRRNRGRTGGAPGDVSGGESTRGGELEPGDDERNPSPPPPLFRGRAPDLSPAPSGESSSSEASSPASSAPRARDRRRPGDAPEEVGPGPARSSAARWRTPPRRARRLKRALVERVLGAPDAETKAVKAAAAAAAAAAALRRTCSRASSAHAETASGARRRRRRGFCGFAFGVEDGFFTSTGLERRRSPSRGRGRGSGAPRR